MNFLKSQSLSATWHNLNFTVTENIKPLFFVSKREFLEISARFSQ